MPGVGRLGQLSLPPRGCVRVLGLKSPCVQREGDLGWGFLKVATDRSTSSPTPGGVSPSHCLAESEQGAQTGRGEKVTSEEEPARGPSPFLSKQGEGA